MQSLPGPETTQARSLWKQLCRQLCPSWRLLCLELLQELCWSLGTFPGVPALLWKCLSSSPRGCYPRCPCLCGGALGTGMPGKLCDPSEPPREGCAMPGELMLGWLSRSWPPPGLWTLLSLGWTCCLLQLGARQSSQAAAISHILSRGGLCVSPPSQDVLQFSMKNLAKLL